MMDPLIITATANVSGIFPDADAPTTYQEKTVEAQKCIDAGASIIHLHSNPETAPWDKLLESLRKSSDCIIQFGQARGTHEERLAVLDLRPDMISMDLSNHDIHYDPSGKDIYRYHPRSEIIEMLEKCSKLNVKPELELWNTGHIWNLNYLLSNNTDNRLLTYPLWTSLVCGFSGGAWSPPSIEYYLFVRKLLPKEAKINILVKNRDVEDHYRVLAAAITNGDNIRVGVEDNPYLKNRKKGLAHELVDWAAQLSRQLGREVATVDEAKEMLKIG